MEPTHQKMFRRCLLMVPEILVADYKSDVVEGQASSVTVVINFPSKEAARAWYDSGEYQEIIHARLDNSEGFLLLADEFKTP